MRGVVRIDRCCLKPRVVIHPRDRVDAVSTKRLAPAEPMADAHGLPVLYDVDDPDAIKLLHVPTGPLVIDGVSRYCLSDLKVYCHRRISHASRDSTCLLLKPDIIARLRAPPPPPVRRR